MKFDEAAKVFDELRRYRITNDETVMKRYPIYQLREALSLYNTDAGFAHHEDLKRYIQEREDEEKRIRERKDKKWWHDPLFLVIAGAVVGGAITGGVSIYIFNAERQEARLRGEALQKISKLADTIQQNNYYINSPQNLKNAIVTINTLSSDNAVMPREEK